MYVESGSVQGETGLAGPLRRLMQDPSEEGQRCLLQGQSKGVRLERAVWMQIRHGTKRRGEPLGSSLS